jgi:hypothetical protein
MVHMLGHELHLPRHSIKQVAHAVAAQESWHDDARDGLRNQMQRDVGNSPPPPPGSLANDRLDDEEGSTHLVEPSNASAWRLAKRGIVWPSSAGTLADAFDGVGGRSATQWKRVLGD